MLSLRTHANAPVRDFVRGVRDWGRDLVTVLVVYNMPLRVPS